MRYCKVRSVCEGLTECVSDKLVDIMYDWSCSQVRDVSLRRAVSLQEGFAHRPQLAVTVCFTTGH